MHLDTRTTPQGPILSAPPRRGFTLVELLVVIAVIGVLLGILIPTIGGVRRAARETSTQSLLRNIRVAIDAFQADHGRVPGYFSSYDMGAQENAINEFRGFTAMENAILELALPGSLQTVGEGPELDTPADDNFNVDVGPFADNDLNVRVDTTVFSASTDSYLSIGMEHFKPVEGQVSSPGEASLGERVLNGRLIGVPDIIDYFGQPILMWTRDTSAQLPPVEYDDAPDEGDAFAALYNEDATSEETGKKASFYWASNAGYLLAGHKSAADAIAGLQNPDDLGLGEERINQAYGSRIGGMMADASEGMPLWVAYNMMAILGSPAFPTELIPPMPDPPLPAVPRGNVILHSAGGDKYFFKRGVAEGTLLQEIAASAIDAADQTMNRLGYRPREEAKANGIAAPGENRGYITPDTFDDLLEATGG